MEQQIQRVPMHINPSATTLKLNNPEAQLRDVANQIAQLLYGKVYGTSIWGILGKKQQVRSSHLRDHDYVVHLPEVSDLVLKRRKPEHVDRVHDYSRHASQIMKDIKAMISHGQQYGVSIKLSQ